jgi:hypothetical protein
VHDIVFGLKEF